MPPENDELEGSPEGQGSEADGGDAVDQAITATLAQTPEAVRSTPEFRALERELRKTARRAGTAERALATARTQAERDRQAAEAERLASMEREITSVLGEDGIAAFSELAELSQSDQVAAARRFAELMAAAAQSQPAAGAPEGAASTEGNVSGQAAPPPPSRGVEGGAPLAPPPVDEDEQTIARLEQVVQEVADRNADPAQRNRVTMRDRATALISYLGAGYVKGIRERNQRTQP